MSLAKLASRLRAHDWTAATIELLIVVVGILIALQVSNWNEERRELARGDAYYRRLHESLVSDASTMNATVVFWKQVSNYGRDAMAHLERGQLVGNSNWKTLLATFQASQMMPFELEDTTFLEMRDNGDLRLIADEGLRKRVSEYYRLTATGTTRARILSHDPEYRRQVRGLTPWHVQEYIWDKCFRQLAGVQQELVDCPAPITEEASAALLEVYRNEPELLSNLRFWMATLRVSELVINGITRVEANRLTRELEAARAR